MKIFPVIFVSLAAVTLVVSCSSSPAKIEAPAPTPLPNTLEDAVNSTFRTPKNKERDQYRHPLETLKFFGIQPEMTVVEIAPGAGWYMEILAPYLTAKGQYIAAGFSPTTEVPFQKDLNAGISAWLAKYPDVLAKTKRVTFQPPADIAPEGTVDLVLTFRNVHNWMPNEKAAFATFYKALKPGGILGVVEHRANPKLKHDPKGKSGYVTEKHVIKVAQSVGFKLQEKSEINANPKDTKDYPEGVWTLPPTYRLKDQDREKYAAIGESDRMTLRFVKPAKKTKK
ncbi:MAG: class I SAM-dependent methyltransferase [Bdellovibrionaceae bacterium]|nr:class I SAM-dependent methyltransferase [Pseudobdellovibrionaceae bacterium]